jgi:hypothetical protein
VGEFWPCGSISACVFQKSSMEDRMRRFTFMLWLLLATPLFADGGQRLIPAGSLVSCTAGDGKISSKTTALGDPVLCRVGHRHGDFMLPYGSYLGGEFSEYKDPGHFVGKGFLKLDFDRLYVGNTVVQVDAKVVDVPGYAIDSQGRVLGKGHATRDTITWLIPILWPIDLIELPRRGPRPTLKAETVLTLRLMEDIKVPETDEPQRDPYGLVPRGSQGYAPDPPAPIQQEPAPQMSYSQPYTQSYPAPIQQPVMMQAPIMAYAVPVAMPYLIAPPPLLVGYGAMMIAPQMIAYSYPQAVYPQPVYPQTYAYPQSGYPQPAYPRRSYEGAQYAPQAYGNRYGYGSRASISPGYAPRPVYSGVAYRRY